MHSQCKLVAEDDEQTSLMMSNRNLQRMSRAIRSWQTLHAKVAEKISGRDVGRLLAKFLLHCLIFYCLKCMADHLGSMPAR